MLHWLKALPLTLALAALSFFTTSCGAGSQAQARFVNGISDDTQSLDIDFNGAKVFSGVQSPGVSASTYVSVPSGSDKIEGFAAGGTTVAFPAQTVSVSSGKQYTLVATGTLAGSVTIVPSVDTNTAPANGSVNFRVINASSLGPTGTGAAVDVYILPNPSPCTPGSSGCAATVSNLAYQDTSNYVTLPFNSAGSGWQMIVTNGTGNTQAYFNDTLANVGSASEGAICTLVLTDQLNGSFMSTSPLKLNDLNCANQ
jgi:Domain of unknown function (DUF4397)